MSLSFMILRPLVCAGYVIINFESIRAKPHIQLNRSEE
jgi:hypothetical protein